MYVLYHISHKLATEVDNQLHAYLKERPDDLDSHNLILHGLKAFDVNRCYIWQSGGEGWVIGVVA